MPSEWARYEERTRLLCERWEVLIRARGFSGPIDGVLRQTIIAGARQWLEVFGEDAQLLEQALDDMVREKLVVKSPASCITFARRIAQWGGSGETEEGRKAYADSLRKYGL